MSTYEARAWWADVQHLHPDAEPAPSAVAERSKSKAFDFDVAWDEPAAPSRHDDMWAELITPARRTVEITGPVEAHAVPTYAPTQAPATATNARRHRPRDRVPAQPDRIALWAVVLGLLLIVLAAAS